MNPHRVRGLVRIVLVGSVASICPGAEETPPALLPAARQAVAPAAPVLPEEVVAAMQQGRYPGAIAALDR
ncbi:MAG TPA: hypothetical protein VF590_02705, partial [Isosphaeraceae bacterium]